MSTPLYSVEQVAERLGLHVRTVRGYVRDGRLKATRIGKQYRIAQADLEALVGAVAPVAAARAQHTDVSAIVDIEVISPDQAMRIANGLVAATNMHSRTSDARLRVDTSYDEDRARLKIVATGDLEPVRALLDIVAGYTEAP